MKTTRLAVLTAAALFAAGAVAFGADPAQDKDAEKSTVTLRSGKTIPDAYILDKRPNGIMLAYKDRCVFIPFSDMPLVYQQKFGYEPVKSARYEKKLDEQKKAAAKEESNRKAREKKRKAEEDKHYKDKRVSAQLQKISRLEIELKEAKKRLETTEKTIWQDRNTLGISSVGTKQISVDSPWGYGGRIRSGEHNAAVTNKLVKEVSALEMKRNDQAQEVIDLELKLEAAQRTLDEMLGI